jgi:hypothetical protein
VIFGSVLFLPSSKSRMLARFVPIRFRPAAFTHSVCNAEERRDRPECGREKYVSAAFVGIHSATGGVTKYLYNFRFWNYRRRLENAPGQCQERRPPGIYGFTWMAVVSPKTAISMYVEGSGCGSDMAVALGAVLGFPSPPECPSLPIGRFQGWRSCSKIAAPQTGKGRPPSGRLPGCSPLRGACIKNPWSEFARNRSNVRQFLGPYCRLKNRCF